MRSAELISQVTYDIGVMYMHGINHPHQVVFLILLANDYTVECSPVMADMYGLSLITILIPA